MIPAFFFALASPSDAFLVVRAKEYGFSLRDIFLILAGFNIGAIAMVLLLKNYGNSVLIMLVIIVCLLFNWMITFFLRSKERESVALRNLFV